MRRWYDIFDVFKKQERFVEVDSNMPRANKTNKELKMATTKSTTGCKTETCTMEQWKQTTQELKALRTRFSALADEMAIMRNETADFRRRVSEDMTKIVERVTREP